MKEQTGSDLPSRFTSQWQFQLFTNAGCNAACPQAGVMHGEIADVPRKYLSGHMYTITEVSIRP